jgi:hydroxymethylbilane synthase
VTGAAWRVGTRASNLARAQAAMVAAALTAQTGRPAELVEISTVGDRSSAPLPEIGGTGVFVTALREALLTGVIDVAVHSYKDLPTGPAAGLAIVAVPLREDPRDALVARDGLMLADLPAGAVIGTGSPRRAAQLRLLGLGLDVVGIRGNVDTRLRKVADHEFDAVVLARAGLSRLGRLDEITESFDPIVMLPAPAQGALAVEGRVDRATELEAALAGVEDPGSRAAVTAERTVLAVLEAGCSAPIGALAEVVDGEDGLELSLRAVAVDLDGTAAIRCAATGPVGDPEGLGRRLAAELLEGGAADLVGLSATLQPTAGGTRS